MIINGRNVRIGSWAEPYVDEILRGGFVHWPVSYIDRKAKDYRKSYIKSWSSACKKINQAGYDLLVIPDHRQGNLIYLLKKSFMKVLSKRLIEEKNGYRMYKLIDRNLFFKPSGSYQVVSCRMTITDMIVKAVEEKLDNSKGDRIEGY